LAETEIPNPQPRRIEDVDATVSVLGRALERLASRLGLPTGTFSVRIVQGTVPHADADDKGNIWVGYDPEKTLKQAKVRHKKDGAAQIFFCKSGW